jgi:hypothetical protein
MSVSPKPGLPLGKARFHGVCRCAIPTGEGNEARGQSLPAETHASFHGVLIEPVPFRPVFHRRLCGQSTAWADTDLSRWR